MAVCGYCRSTLVREGEALRRIGHSAELFDDHTPLQLGSAGRYQGTGFALVGRLQMRHAQGTWNEWHALFDNGRSGWLSEDNGAYVFSFEGTPSDDLPNPADLTPGRSVAAGRRLWSVASVTAVRVHAAEGELPALPQMDRGWTVADLRNTDGEVATLEAGARTAPPTPTGSPGQLPPLDRVTWTIGRSVRLDELALTGLKAESAAQLQGRSIGCPSCGAALAPRLDRTQSLVCGQCKAVVDVSQGLGADLAWYRQDNGLEPLLPLGRVGKIRIGHAARDSELSWQVVGYAQWCETVADAEDEAEFWREYLLYHRTAGFAFLVDANDGWSWSRPLTGVPAGRGERVSYQGETYRKLYSYTARITYVLGEFYWPLKRDQRTDNVDYAGEGAARSKRLYREQTGDEVVWSEGGVLEGAAVARAFKIDAAQARAFARDAQPLGTVASSFGEWALNATRQLLTTSGIVILLFVILFLVSRCDDADDCEPVRQAFGAASNEYQQCLRDERRGGSGRGGSWGGWSSGGGHK